MAQTAINSGSTEQQWISRFVKEYSRMNQFKPYYGKSFEDSNAVITVVEDLIKEAGETVNIPVVLSLSGSGVTGANRLKDNEESMPNYNCAVAVDWLRNGVTTNKKETQKTSLDMPPAIRERLKIWMADKDRDAIISALGSANVDGVTPYASCTEVQKDAWLVANSDRVMFGSALSNYSGDHSVDLAKVDTTNDTADKGVLQIAKRLARNANPKIRPIKVDGGGEWYVAFAEQYAFRDIKAALSTDHQNAEVRGSKNPIWQDGDLMFEGIIIKEVTEIPAVGLVGDSSSRVAPIYLCGAQAVGYAVAQYPQPRMDKDDYDFVTGRAVEACRGFEKLFWNDIQHGVVTIYVSSTADA